MRYCILSMAFAGFVAVSSAGMALAQPTTSPAIFRPAQAQPIKAQPIQAKPIETKPTQTKPAQAKPSDTPPMAFFVAKGEANACGPGCSEWIAADGKIDLAAAQRLRALLAKIGRRKLPIFLNSAGGAVIGAIALGRVIRSQKLEVSVARTIPTACNRDKLRDAACETLMRSGQELASELDPIATWCNSGCVLSLSGGAVRSVPPWVKLGVHAIGIDLQKTATRGAPLAAAITQANSRIVEYLHEMGISKGLFDASDAVPHESHRFLKRDELVLFRVDTRSFGETSWWLMRKPTVAIAKGFFARTGKQEPAYPNALLRLSCGAGKSMRLTFTREPIPNLPLGAGLSPLRLDVNGSRMDLPFGRSAGIETRTVPLLQTVVDSLDDRSEIEIFGFDPDTNNEPQARTILHMDGFSAAYAKLRKTCDAVVGTKDGCESEDSSPRCMSEASGIWSATPLSAGDAPGWPAQ
jgi:hypothetical protein